MAQLSDDCFAFGGPLMPIETAQTLMATQVPVLTETETVPLAAALGRVTAGDVIAPVSLPPFDNSAVDGFAVRIADVAAQGETALRIAGRLQAGAEARAPIAPATAVRIFTGAPMPPGADTVYMQEDCRIDGDSVVVPPGLKRGANRRKAGEDIAAGTVALPGGRRLGPADISLAAAVGLTHLSVRKRVRVAVFSTGNEIVAPGEPLRAAGVYDANRQLLLALLARLGAETEDLGILPDDPAVLAPSIAAAAERHDLVLTSGGVSTGEADHVRMAVEQAGRLVFWRLGIKPGRPVAMGVIAGAAFAGLPGNPVAVFVTFVHVVRPLILRLSGATPTPLTALPVKAAFAYRKKSGRREYVRASLRRGPDGWPEAHKYPQDGAGVITSLTETDGLVELADDVTAVAPGDTVGFLPYAALTA